MNRFEIPLERLSFDPAAIRDQWLVLTAGELAPGKFNSMTISWGSYGQIWNKMFFQVVVRPTRYTFGFMETSDSFTLCAFPESCRKALALIGSRSGRDGDKVRESGLTPIPSKIVSAPGYDEAELIVECRKMYWQDLDPSHFLDASIGENYPEKDYHRAYFGEIRRVSGTGKYLK